jgi:hypothetical protein
MSLQLSASSAMGSVLESTHPEAALKLSSALVEHFRISGNFNLLQEALFLVAYLAKAK